MVVNRHRRGLPGLPAQPVLAPPTCATNTASSGWGGAPLGAVGNDHRFAVMISEGQGLFSSS